MMLMKKDNLGFTLMEMLLVLAIVSSVLIMGANYLSQQTEQARRNRVTLQIQQVLNAALAFYNANGRWPNCQNVLSNSELATNGYVPSTAVKNPWGNSIASGAYVAGGSNACSGVGNGGNGPVFYVSTIIGPATPTKQNVADAAVITGMLPMAYTTNWTNWNAMMTGTSATVVQTSCTAGGSSCYIVASVSIPGQNLNNARSVNYAGIYHSSACVPAPTCPTGMTAAIYVVPAEVRGVNDAPTTCSGSQQAGYTCTGVTAYPVNSFSAFARGSVSSMSTPTTAANVSDCSLTNPQAFSCTGGSPTTAYNNYVASTDPSNQLYWRVCLVITTEKGQVYPSGSETYPYAHGQMMGSVLAITRCIPSGGDVPSGSPFLVWSPNQNYTP